MTTVKTDWTIKVKQEVRKMMATMGRTYDSATWKNCPICREEQTKLLMLFFFQKDAADKWRRCELWTCPPCSRSVTSIPWIEEKFQVVPLGGTVRILDAFRNLIVPDDVDRSGYFYLDLPTQKLVPRGSGLEIFQEGKPREFFPNVAAAMMFLAYGRKETLEVVDWA